MKNEFARQGLHITGGAAYIGILILLPREIALIAISGILILITIVSILQKHAKPIPFIKEIIANAEREHEKGLPGKAAFGFTIGILATALLFYQFDISITIGAITVLTLGDATSTIIGMKFGRLKVAEGKTLEGTIAGITVSAIALLTVFPFSTAILTAIIGMLAEYLPVNDNYSIPLITGAMLVILA